MNINQLSKSEFEQRREKAKRIKPMQGDIYYVDLGQNIGSVQSGVRPCYIISNDINNRYSSCLIVAVITSNCKRNDLPTHKLIPNDRGTGLKIKSIINFEQIFTIDKIQLRERCGHYPLKEVMDGLKIAYGL